MDIKNLVEFHKKHGKIATVTCINFRTNFGIIDIGKNNMVKSFNEKPFINMWINGGFFVFRKEIFDYLDDNSVLEKEPMELLARSSQLVAYKHPGFWECMDTYKDTRMLNETYSNGQAKWVMWEKNVA